MKSQVLLAAAAFVAATSYAQTREAPASASGARPAPTATASADAGASKTDAKAIKKQSEADYMAAKESCHVKKGPDRKWCLREAEASHDRAEAEARGKH